MADASGRYTCTRDNDPPEAQAIALDAAVFDFKAVNPNAVAKVDERTPQQIIANIQAQGRIVAEALTRLHALMAAAD